MQFKDDYELYQTISRNIKYYRELANLTQMQLAELLDIDRSHMSAIELATVGVSLDVIFKMCNILSVSPKDLFDFRS